jgi:hypothetical protein
MKQSSPTFIVGFVVGVLTFLVLVGLLWVWVRRETAKEAQTRHQRECVELLKAAYAAQLGYRAELATFCGDFEALGFQPDRGNYGAYVLDRRGPVAERRTERLAHVPRATVVGIDEFMWPKLSTKRVLEALPPTFVGGVKEGLQGECPERCEVVIACATELETGIAVWSVASFDRRDPRGGVIPAGQPAAEP